MPDESFYRKVRGLRIVAAHPPPGGEAPEHPEIAHLEIQSAILTPAAPGAQSSVQLGWSKAFRAVILDTRE